MSGWSLLHYLFQNVVWDLSRSLCIDMVFIYFNMCFIFLVVCWKLHFLDQRTVILFHKIKPTFLTLLIYLYETSRFINSWAYTFLQEPHLKLGIFNKRAFGITKNYWRKLSLIVNHTFHRFLLPGVFCHWFFTLLSSYHTSFIFHDFLNISPPLK